MREIKFRAWHYEKSEMFPDVFDIPNCEAWFNDEGSAIIQYTGLKDKNGVEIYEGDIVKQPFSQLFDRKGGGKEKRTFDFIGRVDWEDDTCGFIINGEDPRGVLSSFCQLINANPCEVIGNIYENPELLEAEL